jgi:hypothetical protein
MMDIQKAISTLALNGEELYLRVCTVDEVDEDARTVDCTPIDEGAPLVGVNLQADQNGTVGLVRFPEKGTDVVVGFMSPNVAVVLLAAQYTKAVFTIGETEIVVQDKSISIVNGKVKANIAEDSLKLDVDGTTLEMDGSVSTWNGGSETTANANDLKKQLTTMSRRIDALFNAIKSGVPAPMDGGAAYKTSMIGILAAASQKEDFSNIIDDKIKH